MSVLTEARVAVSQAEHVYEQARVQLVKQIERQGIADTITPEMMQNVDGDFILLKPATDLALAKAVLALLDLIRNDVSPGGSL